MAGAAPGVLNTTRQVGGVVGSAVVGAVLQNRLATGLHDQVVAHADQLPPQFRAAFVSSIVVVLVGAVSCLLIQRQKAADLAAVGRNEARERQEEAALTAG